MRPLDGVEEKLNRAKRHAHTFYEAYYRALLADAITIVFEKEPEPGYYIGKVSHLPELPTSLGVILGDAVHNFRSALDHLVWAAALKTNPKPRRITSFIIADSEADFRGLCAGIADLGPNEQAIVERFQPYNRGDGLMRELRILSNRDKHQILNPIMIRTSIIAPMSGGPVVFRGTNCDVLSATWLSDGRDLEIGTEFVRLEIAFPGEPTEPYVRMDGHILPEIAFDQAERPSVFLSLVGIGGEVVIIAKEFERLIEPRPLLTKGRTWPSFALFPDPKWLQWDHLKPPDIPPSRG